MKNLPDVDPDNGATVTLTMYFCNDGGKFYLYVVKGGGLVWPGGYQYFPEFIIGKLNRDIDACQEILYFFNEIVQSNSSR